MTRRTWLEVVGNLPQTGPATATGGSTYQTSAQSISHGNEARTGKELQLPACTIDKQRASKEQLIPEVPAAGSG